MTTTDTAEFFTENPTTTLKNTLLDTIRNYAASAPRSRQKQLGPSQVAHPCMRKLAYQLLDVEPCNPPFDPLPSIIGTATHTWLEAAAKHGNQQLGYTRWHTETRVNVTGWLTGTADLYDADTQTVIDHKVPGTNRMTQYKKDPGPVYRAQTHLYGRGFENAGLPVQNVAILFLPRGGTLAGAHLWQEPYNPHIADQAIQRHHTTVQLIHDLEIEANPDRFDWLQRSGPDCQFCPYWSPNPQPGGLQCSGADTQPPTSTT